jgi:hypothetical protein
MAARLLCDIGRITKLEAASLVSILSVVERLERVPDQEGEPAAEHLSTEFAELEQLDRGQALAAVRRRSQALQPWLARLSKLATKGDLVQLDALMRQHAEPRYRRWLLAAAARVPGPEAQAMIEAWYSRYEMLRMPIAIQLVLRPDVDKQRLVALSERFDDDPSSALFDVALSRAPARKRLSEYLRSDEPHERFAAMIVVKLVGGPEYRPALWRNTRYHDDRFYPEDVKIRQLALSALIDIDLNRRRAPRDAAHFRASALKR